MLSALCLVHCLALPILIALLPLAASQWVADERFHRWMLLAIVPVSALALGWGCRQHRDKVVVSMGVVAVSLLCIAAFGESSPMHMSHFEGALLTIMGGTLLAAAHLRNMHLHRRAHRRHAELVRVP